MGADSSSAVLSKQEEEPPFPLEVVNMPRFLFAGVFVSNGGSNRIRNGFITSPIQRSFLLKPLPSTSNRLREVPVRRRSHPSLNRRTTIFIFSSAAKPEVMRNCFQAKNGLRSKIVPRPPGQSETPGGSAAVSVPDVVSSPIGQTVSGGVKKVTVLSDEPRGSPLEKDSPFLSRILETAIRICKDLLAKIGHVTADNLPAIAKKIRTSFANMKGLLELFYKLFKVLDMESTQVAQCVKRGLVVLEILSSVSPKLAAVSDELTSLAKHLASSFPGLFGQPMPMGKSW